jgi:peptide/nickel transport system permease protein
MRRHTASNPGQYRLAWRRFRRNGPAMVALVYLVLAFLAGAFHATFAPYSSQQISIDRPFSGPSSQTWLGTDELGRDVLSRLLEGAWVSLRFSLAVTVIALLIAVPLGLISGYVGGTLDNVIMRVMDAILSFPGLVLAITIVAMLGPSLVNAGIAITIGLVPGFTRLVRGASLAMREESFMEASRSIGTPPRRILARHLFPNIASPLIVQSALVFGAILLVEAGLSFLGLGAQSPTASWGLMLQRAYNVVLVHPWASVVPGVAIAITVLAFNTIGDGLRDALGGIPPTRKHGRLGLTTVAARDAATPAPASAPSESPEAPEPLLVVEGLTLEFSTPAGPVRVVDDVSFSVASGETLGLVGESGSGKTVTSLSIMRLLPSPPARIVGGSVRFEGRDLLTLSFTEMSRLRGKDIAMVFQDPMASLNPALTVAHQLGQVMTWHESASKAQRQQRVLEVLDLVGIPRRRANSYPHEFSGGMRQRAMIAMALMCNPKLLIADEPTTALDVTIQAQVLELLHELRAEMDLSLIFVTHDLGVVADICDRVAVMYAGQIVEETSVRALFRETRHPYTEGLLRSMPQRGEPRHPLFYIPGQVPQFHELGTGCRLASRCEYAMPDCVAQDVHLLDTGGGHLARCVRVSELELVTKS